jgi:hypothetical protein
VRMLSLPGRILDRCDVPNRTFFDVTVLANRFRTVIIPQYELGLRAPNNEQTDSAYAARRRHLSVLRGRISKARIVIEGGVRRRISLPGV